MKLYIKKYIVILSGICLLFASCENDTMEQVIPEDAPRLPELQQQYQDMLVASSSGWLIEYNPGADSPSVPILMKFFANGTVSMVSDRLNFTDETTSTYRIGGVIGPELIFDTYSVWSSIAETGGGAFEFRMFPQDDGNFILKHATGGNDTEFLLRKAQSSDLDDIKARASIGQLLNFFSESSSAYFRNLILQNISAFWSLDIESQQVTLTWENEQGDNQTAVLSYSTLPGNGIRFAQSWKPRADLEIKDLFFGEATDTALEVISSGAGGSGRIEVGHTPAFPYPGMADLYIFSNSLRTNENPVRFLGYTLDETRISPALRPYYDAISNALPSFWRIQVYNYNPVTAPRNAITFVGRNEAGANIWHYFYYDMQKIDESHVGLTYENANALGQEIVDHPDVQAFLNRIYPPEGVTIVPVGINQRLRVVSRANSNYWIELTISTPANAIP